MLQIMKTKNFILIVFGSLLFNITQAQDLLTYKSPDSKSGSEKTEKAIPVFKFNGYSEENELSAISSEAAGNHIFGDLVAKKLYLLDERYTSQVALTPGNPASKTVIKKPVIYESVKRIERDLKRSSKKGEITLSTAASELNTVLDVALSILTANTVDFEHAIESTGNTQQKIELFTKRVTLTY
jgi:hypothetical protein